MISEIEAKKLWCPFARQLVTLDKGDFNSTPFAVASANRFDADKNGRTRVSLCLGSGCMAWAWDSPEYIAAFDYGRAPPENMGWEKVNRANGDGFYWRRYNTDRKGCCSLMKKPELRQP